MKVSDFANYIESLFPLETAAGFDNPGLNIGFPDNEVSRVIVCLDCTQRVVLDAMELNAELVFSHHPLIFGGIDSINVNDPKGQIICKLIRAGISLYSAHTNLDANDKFSNNILALVLGAKEESIHGIDEIFCGVVGELKTPMTLKDFVSNTRIALNASGVITYGKEDKKVQRIFAQGGAFDEESINYLVANGVDTVISGEIKHHVMLQLEELGITGIIASHNATERIFMKNISEVLQERFPDIDFVYFDGSERIF